MMWPTHEGKCGNFAQVWRFNSARLGRIFAQRQMRPARMVVTEIFTKDPAQVLLIEHDDVIQTIPPYGTDHAFDEWILPR
jgi:hypothetical protein